MRFLLDTHALLWARASPDRLSPQALAVLQSLNNVLYVSVATLWECAIKASIGKLDIPEGFFGLIANDYQLLDVELAHLEATTKLPLHHRDPFDRLLVVQAQLAGLTLLTRDRFIRRYEVQVLEA